MDRYLNKPVCTRGVVSFAIIAVKQTGICITKQHP